MKVFKITTKVCLMLAISAAAWQARAEAEYVNGYTWRYRIIGDTAMIDGGGEVAAISPPPTGALSIPDLLGGKPVNSIGAYAFRGCSGLTSVTIGNGVTNIGNYAFYNCSGLTSVTIGGGVTSIEGGAFSGCSGLTSVTIPDSVTSIGYNAFSGCSGLTSVAIPDGVTSIGDHAFSGCSGLTSVTIPQAGVDSFKSAFDEYVDFALIISDSVTNIGYRAFFRCKGLTSVTIGNGVTSIGQEAFSACKGLTSVMIPDSVTSIGPSAFSGCSGLTSVTIPDSVTSIGHTAFFYCCSLTNIVLPNSLTDVSDSTIFAGCTNVVNMTIPQCLCDNGLSVFPEYKRVRQIVIQDGVTHIGTRTFEDCTNLVSITIPNSVTNIGDYAFRGCSGLTSVTIPDSVTSIGSYAFYGCSGLTSVTIGSGVTSIEVGAFSDCSESLFDTTTIPGVRLVDGWAVGNTGSLSGDLDLTGVRGIGGSAFSGCSGLTSVTIPNSVTSIGDYVFFFCSGLTSVTIPNSVTSIGDRAFSGCSGLTSVTIGSGVTSIEGGAFSGCSGLTSVTIPDSVTSIGYNAFYGCSGLTSMTIGNGVTSIGSLAFYNYSSSYYDVASLCLRMLGDRPTFANDAFEGRDVVLFVDENNAAWKIDGVLPESFAVGASTVKLHPWNVPTLITGVARSSFVYDGTEMKPNLACLYGDTELLETLGAEYDIEYFDNVNVGTGRVVVTGKNGFPGRAEYTFAIEKATVYPPYISGKTYAGGTMTADVPSSDLWRVVSNDGGVDAGDYDVTLELTDPANYKWSGSDSAQVMRTFTIGRKSINGASVELGPSLTFTGEVQTQTVHGVTLNGVAVTFDVFDNDVRDVGTYTLTVYGTGNYMGSAQVSFSVAQMVIDPPTLAEKAYTGGNLTADVPESQWYTVSANFGGTDPGIYWVMLTLADEANTRWSITDDRMAVVPFEIVSGASPGGDDPVPPGPPAPATYMVTYRPGTYGTGALQTATKTEGVVLVLKGAIFTREGYTQTGWATTDGGAKAYGLGASYAVNAAVTLFPFWTKNASPEPPGPPSVDTVTVTFNANGGSGDATRQVEKGAAIGELPVARRTGYTFAGWWTATEQATVKTKVTKNVTYYAKWTANKYKIKFNRNGGKGTMKTLSATYGKNVRLTANAFKRTGYKFAGWATTKSGAVAYKNKAKVKNLTATSGKTVTLYAVWKKPSYTVKFNANGGTGAAMRQTIDCSSKTALAKNTYVREGFVFAGWATKKNGPVAYKDKAKVKDLAKKGKTVTLYAVWRPAKWAVGSFSGEGEIGGQATLVALTVASSGKISGKFVLAKNFKAYSFKANGFDGFSGGALRASAPLTFGKKKCTLKIAVGRDEETGEAVPAIDVIYNEKEYGWGFAPPS